jgi:hypothetical protein
VRAQPCQHVALVGTGGQPEHAPRAVQHRIRQGHAAPPLVGLRQRNIRVAHLQHRIAGHQRCGMPVAAKSQVHQVEHRRFAGDGAQRAGVGIRRGIEVGIIDRHRVQLPSRQARAQVRQVALFAVGRGDPFIDLEHVHREPGHVQAGQHAQHRPRRAPATEREREAAARLHGAPGFGGNELGRAPRHRIGIGEFLDLHQSTFGSCQPAGGASRCAASGPQLPGAYPNTGVSARSTGSTMRQASST